MQEQAETLSGQVAGCVGVRTTEDFTAENEFDLILTNISMHECRDVDHFEVTPVHAVTHGRR